jgi:hypothetical protein
METSNLLASAGCLLEIEDFVVVKDHKIFGEEAE